MTAGPKPTGKLTLFIVRALIVIMVAYATGALGWMVVQRMSHPAVATGPTP